MKFKIEEWTILDLILLYQKNKLDLNPPYQRNFIWTKKDQDSLIDSIINKEFPLPTFFLFRRSAGDFEMVDGQQRTRTILNYYKKNFEVDGKPIDRITRNKLEQSKLSVTVITEVTEQVTIEEFYARVNKTGKKLNRPELAKAQYFYTKFLELNEELAQDPRFNSLELFTDSSANRMNDIEFVSELVAGLKFGFFDKKTGVDELYESDISENERDKLRKRFLKVLDVIVQLSDLKAINETRYSQRNDFFTLFCFININYQLAIESFKTFYKILVEIDSDIAPSNDFCEPFKEYAINCVSQSNSKKARERRNSFLVELFLNEKSKPNETQSEIIEFYGISSGKLLKVENYYTLNPDLLREIKES
ncbi:MAG: DUF262 domain-containing protein [Cyclobacteriaceae bacterium]